MTRKELQAQIQSLEDCIQRKELEISRHDAVIIKCDSNIMSAGQSMARNKNDVFKKIYQRKIESIKKINYAIKS